MEVRELDSVCDDGLRFVPGPRRSLRKVDRSAEQSGVAVDKPCPASGGEQVEVGRLGAVHCGSKRRDQFREKTFLAPPFFGKGGCFTLSILEPPPFSLPGGDFERSKGVSFHSFLLRVQARATGRRRTGADDGRSVRR